MNERIRRLSILWDQLVGAVQVCHDRGLANLQPCLNLLRPEGVRLTNAVNAPAADPQEAEAVLGYAYAFFQAVTQGINDPAVAAAAKAFQTAQQFIAQPARAGAARKGGAPGGPPAGIGGPGGGNPPPAPDPVAGIERQVENLITFPLTISNVDGGSSGGGSGISNFDSRINGAIRSVLGRVPNNAQTLTVALNRTFDVQEKDGHTSILRRVGPYAGEGDLGGILTGAHAAIQAFATQILKMARESIKAFTPLDPAFNEELTNSARAVTLRILDNLDDELARTTGPIDARVQTSFRSLFDDRIPLPGGKRAAGYIDYLAQVFGLRADFVNTVDQELDFTRLVTVRQSLRNVRDAYNQFLGQKLLDRDLGTLLVKLSRVLAAANETLADVNTAMDRVYVDEAARQAASFTGPGNQTLYLEDILSWWEDFTREQATQMLNDGGRLGADAVAPMAGEIDVTIDALIREIQGGNSLPRNLNHPGVIKTLQEFRTYMRQVQDLATNIAPQQMAAAN